MNTIALQATRVMYYSPGDDAAFFEWLDKIPCVRSSVGRYITVDTESVDDEALRDLTALFERYHLDLSQLQYSIPREIDVQLQTGRKA